MKTKTLIVACGSTVRGDDRAGRRVVDLLEREEVPGIKILRVHQLTPELAEVLARARRTIIVDAGVGKRSSFRRLNSRAGAAFTHHLTPETLVGLVERLYGVTPEVYLLTVPGNSFALSEQMSAPATRAARRAARRLIRFLEGAD